MNAAETDRDLGATAGNAAATDWDDDAAAETVDTVKAGDTADGVVSRSDTDRRLAEEADLSEGLFLLSQLTNRLDLEDLLVRVASYAVTAIPGADGAGLTLIENGRPLTVGATAEFVRNLDALQYEIGQGPSITAAREGRSVVGGSLAGDVRWRRFGGTVARLGVHSVLALPLITADEVIGALTVYSYQRYAFDERAAELAETYAVPAAVAVQNAHVLAQTQRLTERLQAALATRGVIDRAVGIMMSRGGGTENQALERLRALSQHEQAKLHVVAQQIIDEAVRRAHARHPDEQG